MNIVPSLDFFGPHNGEYRLPSTAGEPFKEAVETLSRFMDYYYTPPSKGESMMFSLELSRFSSDQQYLLQPLLKKKNIKII